MYGFLTKIQVVAAAILNFPPCVRFAVYIIHYVYVQDVVEISVIGLSYRVIVLILIVGGSPTCWNV